MVVLGDGPRQRWVAERGVIQPFAEGYYRHYQGEENTLSPKYSQKACVWSTMYVLGWKIKRCSLVYKTHGDYVPKVKH